MHRSFTRTTAALILGLGSSLLSASAPIPAATVQKAQLSTRVFQAQAHMLGLRNQLGLGNVEGFVVKNAFTSPEGKAVVRLDQTHDGFRVWGGRVLVRVSPDGRFLTNTKSVRGGIQLTGAPKLSATEAERIALANLTPKGALVAAPKVEQVVFPWKFRDEDPVVGRTASPERSSAPYVWAYEVRTCLHNAQDGMKEMTYVIDGNTGAVLRSWDEVKSATPAVGTGNGYYNGTVTLNTVLQLDGTYSLWDTTRGTLPNPMLSSFSGTDWTPTGIQAWYDANDASGNTTYMTYLFQGNATDAWGDGKTFIAWGDEGGINGQTAGVDALYGMGVTWDFYRNVFGREGLDGLGTSTYAQVLDRSSWYLDNAAYSSWGMGVTFGDGSYPANPNGYLSLTELDIVAHEMTHGVTEFSAGFYDGEGYEEGGMNEGTSDFFAQMVKAYASRPASFPANMVPPTGATWEMGTAAGRGTPLRWMVKPSKDQRSLDGYFDGIKYMDPHYSCATLNRALYFLVNGASSDSTADSYSTYLPAGMTGVGNDAAARIWYNVLTEQMVADGTGSLTYADARAAAMTAAEELYGAGSSQEIAVENAFAAANIGDAHGQEPRVQVVFADWRNGDWIQNNMADFYANRQIFPKGETVTPRITVNNAADTSVVWSIGGPSMFNGSDSFTSEGGKISADGQSWTTPLLIGKFSITATSKADPTQFAEGRCAVINMDTDGDGEVDALDMGAIAFSWWLDQDVNMIASVFEAPLVDTEDVAFFVDGMRNAWPVK